MENSNIYKEETAKHGTVTGEIPACCLTCGYYLPQFHTVVGKQCAAFGTVQGVKWDRCGAWTPRVLPPRA